MKRFWNWRLLLIFSALCVVPALQAVLRPVEHRYLFVLETSKEMKRQGEAAQNVLIQLIYSGVMGQMRAGDTLGIWTYNDTLHAGGLPMQTFTPEDRESIAARAAEYVKSIKFTGEAHLETALLPMLKLATNSPDLTVILISDGKQAIVGTPFDKDIRDLHNKYYAELRDSKLPFVTVLVAYHGEFISYAVNSALGPIRVPRLPKPPAPTNSVAKIQRVDPATNHVTKVGESLYLRGPLPKKNTSTETNITPAPVIATTTAEPAKVETATTNSIAEAVVVPTSPPVTAVAVTPQIAAAAPTTAIVAPAVAEPQSAPSAALSNHAAAETAAPVKPISAAPVPERAEPPKINPPAKEQVSNVASFAVQETKASSASAVTTPSVAVVPESQPEVPAPKPSEKPVVENHPAASPPVVVAEVQAPSTLRIALVTIGVLLLGILIVLVLMLRKSRNAHPSLITQSIDKRAP